MIFIYHKRRKSVATTTFICDLGQIIHQIFNSTTRFLLKDLLRGKNVFRDTQDSEGKFSRNAFLQLAVTFDYFFFTHSPRPSFPLINLPLGERCKEKRAAKRTRILIFLAQDGEIAITTSGAIETGPDSTQRIPFKCLHLVFFP